MQRRTMAIARLNTPESVGGALRRAAASGGGVVPAGLVMVSMPPKVAGDRPKDRVAGPLVGSLRSIDDHVALHKRRLHKLLSYHLRQRWSRCHAGMTGMRRWLASQSSRRSMPEQLRGDGGALGEAFQLRPHDRTVYAAGERALREATICAGHDAVAANDVGVAQQPLGNEVGMLDDVGRMRNETRH